jgi:hypothetical protein
MLVKKKNVNDVQRWRNEFGTPPPMQHLHTCRVSLGVMEECKTVESEHSEDLAVQLTMEVLRQCYRPSHNLQEVYMAML